MYRPCSFVLFISGVPSAYHCVISLILSNHSKKFIFTARKRSLGQDNVFTPVCHSVHRGCLHPGGSAYRGDLHPGASCIWEGWTDPRPPSDAMGYGQQCIRYASYWNALFFILRYVHHCNSHNGQNKIITDRYSQFLRGFLSEYFFSPPNILIIGLQVGHG